MLCFETMKNFSIDKIRENFERMAEGEIPTNRIVKFDQDDVLIEENLEYDQESAQETLDRFFNEDGQLRHDLKWHWVYAVQMQLPSGDVGPIKIGKASNPEKRLLGLQVGCPYPLKFLSKKHTKFASRLESDLHKHFGDRRLRGEWFDLSEKQIQILLHELNS